MPMASRRSRNRCSSHASEADDGVAGVSQPESTFEAVTDLVCEGPSAIHGAGVVAETADIVLKWPYPPQTVLPQRWAVSVWGEACWTYMAMWTPEALSRLQERTPNVAVFFHELGESLRRDMQAPPTLDEWWRNPRTERPTQPEIEADPVTVVPPERPAPAALPPPKHAVPDMFHRTVTAPSASAAMAELLKEITGVTFHALQVLQTAQRDTLENLLTVEQRHRFSEQLTALGPASADTMQAQWDHEDLTLLPQTAVGRWEQAAAAWYATLAIRYETYEPSTEPLARAVMQALISQPVPATRLPSVPCELLDPVTKRSAISEMLPAVPDERLDAFVDLRPNL